jgi:hypothetical protein
MRHKCIGVLKEQTYKLQNLSPFFYHKYSKFSNWRILSFLTLQYRKYTKGNIPSTTAVVSELGI